METNFVDEPEARRTARPQECETCHVDMEMHFLASWARE